MLVWVCIFFEYVVFGVLFFVRVWSLVFWGFGGKCMNEFGVYVRIFVVVFIFMGVDYLLGFFR